MKADYVHPLAGTPWRAEAGAKASWVTTHSAITFDQLQQDEWQPDASRSNQFQYDEVIEAGYASLSTTLHQWELKAGLRGEHTYSLGQSPGTSQRVERNYFQLFPSAFVSRQVGEHDQVSVAAGRRITRPTYQNLNPFVSYTDAYTAIQGNPFLLPSLANSFVINYVHRDFQVLSLSYLRETNVVNLVTYQNDQTKVTTTRPENLDQALTVSLTSGGHMELTKWWGMDNQLVASYGEVQSQVEGQQVELRRVSATFNTDHTLRLPRQYQLLVSGSYSSPSVQGLYYLRSSGYLNLGLKKQLWNGRATLSLRASDLLRTNRYRSVVTYNNINMVWNNQWESRRVSLTLTMKLSSGKTHASHASGSSDEEGRAGH
ncbi:outer membrane beta-barrel family protein [Hymenobacter baengnokdamensis]|uniref:outer membrane beta-barrel family protein n=1 Tax=Hymenobacter baengnokdamensis TaxID=2615203 RepID=UPI001E28735A|nr:outer membrane beta-barrel family protein [Hymenobacter baengnokdamensis]